ncbi:hypothetical protein KC366_g97 [Hortaea werneckii]|nr:hypothetical protein KC366_g97 [Hortaea werneckii]
MITSPLTGYDTETSRHQPISPRRLQEHCPVLLTRPDIPNSSSARSAKVSSPLNISKLVAMYTRSRWLEFTGKRKV